MTIMIGHYLATLYGSILESNLSIWAERNELTTFNHLLTPQAVIDSLKKVNVLLLCGFQESLQHYHMLGSHSNQKPLESQQIYGEVSLHYLNQSQKKLCIPIGSSKAVASKIGIKQGCTLSCTLFSLYTHDMSNYIERLRGSREFLAGVLYQYYYMPRTLCLSPTIHRINKDIKMF